MAKKKDLKASVENQIKDMLESKDEPSEGRMKLLALGIKMCALNAKLEESDYGGFFGPDDEPGSTGDLPKRKDRPKPNGGSGEATGPDA